MAQEVTGSFENLPYEILQNVLDYLRRPTDLKSLCLVSKHVSNVAFSRLYRDIVIPEREDDPSWQRIRTLAESNHLHEIKSLHLGTWPTCHDQPRYCENLHALILKLRPHTLQSFVFETNCRPRADYLVVLWKMQRSLKKLYFDFKLCAPAINEIFREYKNDLQRLRNVEELEIDFADSGEKEAVLLFQCLHLERLQKITLESVVPKSLRVNNPSFGPNFFNEQLPRTLTHICFRQMSFHAPSAWQLNEFDRLESLTLMDCVNADSIISSLRPQRLKHLHIIDSDAHPLAVSHCLSNFDSLETLSIKLSPQSSDVTDVDVLLIDGTLCHRRQLKFLRFSTLIRGMSEESLDRLLSGCQELETLILGSGLWRLFKGAKSIYDEVPDLDTTYISFQYRPKLFIDNFAKLQQAWTNVAHFNADLILSNEVLSPTLKFLTFEYGDRILYGGAGFYASELTRHSCFTRPEYSSLFGIKEQDEQLKIKDSKQLPHAVQINPKLVPYVLPDAFAI